jgi:hypothetical protein
VARGIVVSYGLELALGDDGKILLRRQFALAKALADALRHCATTMCEDFLFSREGRYSVKM